jgi:signal peptidase I
MAPVLITLLVYFISSLFIQAALLWVICKLYQARRESSGPPPEVSPIGYRRAFVAVLLNTVVSIAVAFGVSRLPFKFSNPLPVQIVAGIVALLLSFLVLVLVLRLRMVKGVLVAATWVVLATGYGVATALFILKPFFLDAFIIPTGNMALTIRGYHKEIVCPSCGHAFDVNASEEAEPHEGFPPHRVERCRCPNCDLPIRLMDTTGGGRAERGNEIEDPGVRTGDHILVAKGPLAGNFPNRMDLVVFTYPPDPRMNYVKRIVGMPGETLAIHGGDLYRAPGKVAAPLDDDAKSSQWLRVNEFEIIRKSPDAMLALRRLVHDNDHLPKDLKAPEHQRWRLDDSGWKENGPHGFSHAQTDGEMHSISYRHFQREHGGKPSLITDVLGYNSGNTFQGAGVHWVGDLLLECEVSIEKSEGTFMLEVVRAGERFQAAWELSTGECELRRIDESEKIEKFGQQKTKLSTGTHTLRLASVDDRLTVWVDGALPFGDGVAYERPKRAVPTMLDLVPARIGAKDANLSVRRIKLFRDTYFSGNPHADVFIGDWTDSKEWEGLAKLPIRTMYVEPGHYFVLGDNPMHSSDSRSWGLVPERLLLGKPVMVYYPWSRAGALR